MTRSTNPLIAATVAAMLLLGAGVGVDQAAAATSPRAHASVINRQAVKQRTRVEAWRRCRDDEVASRGLYECWETRPHRPKTPNVQVYGCVFRSLSYRKASCEAEYLLRVWNGQWLHCYGRATWRGNGNAIRLTRFWIDCTGTNQG